MSLSCRLSERQFDGQTPAEPLNPLAPGSPLGPLPPLNPLAPGSPLGPIAGIEIHNVSDL